MEALEAPPPKKPGLVARHGKKAGVVAALVGVIYVLKSVIETQATQIASMSAQVDFLIRLVDSTCGK